MVEWLLSWHTQEGITGIIATGGTVALTLIVFVETGLLVGFFLPGDSLLITAGVLASPSNPNAIPGLDIVTLNLCMGLAAMIGDQVGYFLGYRTGGAVWNRPDGRFFKRRHLQEAHDFYVRYGAWAIVCARYVPIFRTFVPFVAGVARLPYRNFVRASLPGAAFWVTSLLWIGYGLGRTEIANRLDKLILLIIFVSVIPIGVSVIKRWAKARLRGRGVKNGVSGSGG